MLGEGQWASDIELQALAGIEQSHLSHQRHCNVKRAVLMRYHLNP
jgi:hypothetical protein